MRAKKYFTKNTVKEAKWTPCIAYGGGVNSVAMVLLMIEKGIQFKHILFSDTKGEKPGTYDYNHMFSDYLKEKGYPGIIRISRSGSLYDDCIAQNRLPSIAYGFKSCSEVWKRRPYVQFLIQNDLFPVITYKGIDAGEEDRQRDELEIREKIRYPLVEEGMDREDCKDYILQHGLPLPPKSACFFCPSSSPADVRSLPPDLQEKALLMEKNAKKKKGSSIRGLGRRHRWEDWLKIQELPFEEFTALPKLSCDCDL
jgi:hypothetical protein